MIKLPINLESISAFEDHKKKGTLRIDIGRLAIALE